MAPNVVPRDVSALLGILRKFLLGRSHTKALRFSPAVATRSPPLPVLPEGPHHRLFANYYFKKDGRRELAPPALIYSPQKQIGEGSNPQVATFSKPRRPGNVYSWD